jgi:hypothetical protein
MKSLHNVEWDLKEWQYSLTNTEHTYKCKNIKQRYI